MFTGVAPAPSVVPVGSPSPASAQWVLRWGKGLINGVVTTLYGWILSHPKYIPMLHIRRRGCVRFQRDTSIQAVTLPCATVAASTGLFPFWPHSLLFPLFTSPMRAPGGSRSVTVLLDGAGFYGSRSGLDAQGGTGREAQSLCHL